MASNSSSREYPIKWDETAWERALWRPDLTFQPVLQLIDQLALDHNRAAIVDEIIDLPQPLQAKFAIDGQGKLVSIEPETRGRRSVALTEAVHRSVRELMRQQSARVIRQVDVPQGNGKLQRTIVVRWDKQKATVAAQIKKLHRAVTAGSVLAIESAWFGLTPRAHDYLSVGFKIARRQGKLSQYSGELEVSATVIPVRMVAPELLSVILPYAMMAASSPGRRRSYPRDEALASVLSIFNDITGSETASARRGDQSGPYGRGADFVRRIEKIFGVELMPEGSTHAVARAKQRIPKRSA